MEFEDRIPVSLVSEPFESSKGSAIEVRLEQAGLNLSSQPAELISMSYENSETMRTMQRIEEMLIRLIAERRAPPTPDPPDPHTEWPRSVARHQIGAIQSRIDSISPSGLTSRLPYLGFPRFDGSLIREWISQYEQAFFLERTPPEMKVRQASLYFEGKALQWHLNYIRNRYDLYPSWPEYIVDILAQFGRERDVDVIDHNRWVELSARHDKIDCNVQSIGDLKDYGLEYTPMVIDDDQMFVNELADPIAHQVLDKMSTQNESKEIEVSDESLDPAASQMNVDEKRDQMYEFSSLEAPQMLEERAKEPSGLVGHLPFDAMSGFMEKGIDLFEGFPKEIMLLENVVSPDKGQGALSFDPGGALKGLSKSFNPKGDSAQPVFDPGGDYLIAVRNGLLAGILNPWIINLTAMRAEVIDLFELQLVFDPGIAEKLIETVVTNPDVLIDMLKEKKVLVMYGETYLVLDQIDIVFDPGGRDLLLPGGSSHELDPIFAGRKEWNFLHLQLSVYTYLSQTVWSSNGGCQYDFLAPTLYKVKVTHQLEQLELHIIAIDYVRQHGGTLALVTSSMQLEKYHIPLVLIYELKDNLMGSVKSSNSCCEEKDNMEVMICDPGGEGFMAGNHAIYSSNGDYLGDLIKLKDQLISHEAAWLVCGSGFRKLKISLGDCHCQAAAVRSSFFDVLLRSYILLSCTFKQDIDRVIVCKMKVFLSEQVLTFYTSISLLAENVSAVPRTDLKPESTLLLLRLDTFK